MNIIGIIPARYKSTRFPGKPLVNINGKSMIQRVYEQALQSTRLGKVVIATDDDRILKHVQEFNGEVVMTAPHHLSGTDRCAEVTNPTFNRNRSTCCAPVSKKKRPALPHWSRRSYHPTNCSTTTM